MRLIAVLRQLTALLITLPMSFSKENAGTSENEQRNGVTGNKTMFQADFSTELEQMYAANITSEEQEITAADDFTMNGIKEKLKSHLADDVLYNATSNYVSNRHMNSMQRYIISTLEDQKDTMMRLSDDLTDLQDKVNSRRGEGEGEENACELDNNENDEINKKECLPPDCIEALKITDESGIHKIKPYGTDVTSFYVYCLKDDASGGPWTVIQRRINDWIDFDHTWYKYKIGFGSIDAELWLGMDHIYTLTNSDSYELRITLKSYENVTYVANYDRFLISNEETNYTLLSMGKHSGNATDANMQDLLGQMWSTKDRDNDQSVEHCAEKFKAGWWYNDCTYNNMNGEFAEKNESKLYRGIYWGSIQNETFRQSEMAIRIKK